MENKPHSAAKRKLNTATSYRIVAGLHVILVAYLIINGNLLLKDIGFIYLLVLIPALVFIMVEYLFKRDIPFSTYLKDKLLTNLIILIIIFGMVIFCTTTRYISREKAVNDLEFMVKSLEDIHPDIYHIIPKDSFSIRFNQEINQLPDKISEAEFHKICSRLASFFGTAHTVPMGNLLGKRNKYLFNRPFPYKTRIIGERLFVTGNLSLFNTIRAGSEILEINGKTVSRLIGEWSRLVSYESESWRNNQITQPQKIGLWNDFKPYRIRYREPGSREIKEKSASGGISANMVSFLAYRKEHPIKLFYREISPKIGYIGFFDCHDLKHFVNFYQSTFRTLKDKRIDNLIIDIRGNGGGYTSIGAELMQYIFHQPFKETDSTLVKVSRELIATGKVADQMDPEKRVPGKTYMLVPDPYELRENPLRFEGKTWLLTDNGTFSAGQVFASSYRCYGHGTIVGEETGGVTVTGDVHMFNLPDSGLKMMTSWKRAFSACGTDEKRGVIPDYVISNSPDDYSNNLDRTLEFAIGMINKDEK